MKFQNILLIEINKLDLFQVIWVYSRLLNSVAFFGISNIMCFHI